jgi:hypothetical protein
MDIRLYINDFLVDLDPNQKISYTKQVNTFESMADRQANFSKSFKVPKTSRNVKYFKGLGISGSTSELPYQKNTARLFVRNLCLIYKGWANVLESTDDAYDVNIYDGNIDFFKLLDNLKFDQIPIPEIEHTKTVQTIIDTWNNNYDFHYFLADYNGKTVFSEGGQQYLNIDYMVPNIQCKFLWDKIFNFLGYEYSMQAASDYQFTDNYLTYPKGVKSGEVGAIYFSMEFDEQKMVYYWPYVNWLMWPDKFSYSTVVNQGQIIDNSVHNELKAWEVPESGYYEIHITGTIDSRAKKGVDSMFYWARNLHNRKLGTIYNDEFIFPNADLVAEKRQDFDYTRNLFLNAGDTITFIYDKEKMVQSDNSKLNFSADISKISEIEIGQSGFFKGLTVKDFFREILWRFGLTPYTVKDQNKIDFLTWDERINGDIEDWSDRFQEHLGESYAYNNYAKQNWLRYKYHDESEDFNDGVFKIKNENLDETRDVIKSKTYSREKDEVNLTIPSDANSSEYVPKLMLWEQELKTDNNGDPIIEYKSLDSRYIFIHKITRTKTNARIGSEQLGVFQTTNTIDFATTRSDDSMQRQFREYYAPLLTLLNRTKIIKALFRLNVFEFDAFDLKPRIYVEQLGGEFIVNKLTKNDLTSDFAIAELIKINR